MKYYRLSAIIFCITIIAVSTAFARHVRTAVITTTLGKVQVMFISEGKQVWSNAKPGMTFKAGDRVRTGRMASARFTLDDGTIITVKDRTVARFELLGYGTAMNKETTFQVESGSVKCSVQPIKNQYDSFLIKGPNARIKVKGTRLGVCVNKSGYKLTTDVLCFEGIVGVDNPNVPGSAQTVTQGQYTSIINNTSPVIPIAIPQDQYSVWNEEPNIPAAPIAVKESTPEPTTPAEPEVVPIVEPEPRIEPVVPIEPVPEPPPEPAVPVTPVPPADESMPVIVQPTNEMQNIVTNTSLPQKKKKERNKVKCEPNYDEKESDFELPLDIGFESIGGNNYSRIILQPTFYIWRFGFGFYLPIYHNTRFDAPFVEGLYNRDAWDFISPKDSLHDLLYMFKFISYGKKGSRPFFARIGSINSITLGHGGITKNYSNMVNFPQIRRIGVQADIDVCHAGIETFLADAYRAEIFGGRLFTRPFYFMKGRIPLIPLIEFGGTYVEDINPVSGMGVVSAASVFPATGVSNFATGTMNPAVAVYGVDAGAPIINAGILKLNYELDYQKAQIQYQHDNAQWRQFPGYGFSTGFVGRLAIFDFETKYLLSDNKFKFQYFNSQYEAYRAQQAAWMWQKVNGMLPAQGLANGYYVLAGASIDGKFKFYMDFWEEYKSVPVDNRWHIQLDILKEANLKLKGSRIWGSAAVDKTHVIGKTLFTDPFLDDNTVLTFNGYITMMGVPMNVSLRRTFSYNEKGELVHETSWGIGIAPTLF